FRQRVVAERGRAVQPGGRRAAGEAAEDRAGTVRLRRDSATRSRPARVRRGLGEIAVAVRRRSRRRAGVHRVEQIHDGFSDGA
ncbi:MAG: hypothetical protein FJ388_08190, partial [Verrucomicrobia bacterium]|nr:hypothetical protein [Verrucomicrobiota bacterium]